jgi:enamine deaminase RidA (YjgF/YER057c/UK114 family)
VIVGDLVFVAGTVGVDMATHEFPDGIVAQMDLALKNLSEVLAAADCRLEHVVKTTTFITPAAYENDEEADAAEDLYAGAFLAEPKPARSSPMVILPIPEALVSIEAIAVRPTG